jgi:TolB-like protein
MAALAVALLGGFEIRSDGVPRDLTGQKERALLAILALPPGVGHPRERLAGMLWGDRGEAQARDSLKHALARLRSALGPDTVVADRQSARLDPTAVDVDVARFEALLRDGRPEAIERALALYRGELLDGISVRDPGLSNWLAIERERLRRLAETAAARLLAEAEAAGARDRAALAARRLLALDPLRENAVRALMRQHRDRGEGAQALKLYVGLRDRLHRDLGVRPEPETSRLADDIREGRDAAVEAGATPEASGPPLPDRPSIAVLAFENLSGDPAQDYFADGIVEEIIGALSRMRWLFVIARNSSFTYKGRAVDVKQIGRELGVRYVVEGSLRKSADRVRIAAHLIDAGTGAHLWADRFEGPVADIFDLQDQLTASVIGAIAPKLEQAEIARAKRKPTKSLDAYDYYLRGLSAVHAWREDTNREALAMFGKAIERDPAFAAAYGFAARCNSQRKACGWPSDRERDVAEVRRLAALALKHGPDDAVALSTSGIALAFVAGEISEGGALLKRALALNPNLAMTWLFSGWAELWNGVPEAALEKIGTAMRLSP